MDPVEIGRFLAVLRKEHNLTQEQLGQKLGVTNKTVSRWENGNYLPPVEILQDLSELYRITINEILSGQRLSGDAYQQMAEENIKSVMASSFTLKEKIAFYKKKWVKDHIISIVLGILVLISLLFWGILHKNIIWIIVSWIAYLIFYAIQRNRMMIYVESRAFDGSGIQ